MRKAKAEELFYEVISNFGVDIIERHAKKEPLFGASISSNSFQYVAKSSGDYSALYVSPGITKLTGYSASDFVKSDSWLSYIHSDDISAIDRCLLQAMEKGSAQVYYRFTHKDKKELRLSDQVWKAKWDKHDILIGTITLDYSPLEVRRRLGQASLKLSELLGSDVLGAFFATDDGAPMESKGITDVVKPVLNSSCIPHIKNWQDYIHFDDREKVNNKWFAYLKLKGDVFMASCRAAIGKVGKEPSFLWIEVIPYYCEVSTVVTYVGLITDMTSVYRLMRGRERAIADIFFQFRNPIAGIGGEAESLEHDLGLLIKKQKRLKDLARQEQKAIEEQVLFINDISKAAPSADSTQLISNFQSFVLQSRERLKEKLALTEQTCEMLQDLQKNVDNIQQLFTHTRRVINNILDLSMLNAGEVELKNTPSYIGKVIKEAIGLCSNLAERMNTEINLFGKIKGIVISIDVTRLKQVVEYLLSNAIRYGRGNPVTITVKVCKSEAVGKQNKKISPGHLSVVVEDLGEGIEPKYLAKIFKAFEKKRSSNTCHGEGNTGLGLVIANELVRLMGGDDIAVKSDLGKGSRFSFILPCKIIKGVAQRVSPAAITPRFLKETTLPILVVEDNLINRKTLIMFLGREGFSVVGAENGQIGLDLFKKEEQKYLMVFMDMEMPVMNGCEANMAIRKFEKEKGRVATPIIMLTANTADSDRERAINSGANIFLSKPASANEKRRAIKTAALLIGQWEVEQKKIESRDSQSIPGVVKSAVDLDSKEGVKTKLANSRERHYSVDSCEKKSDGFSQDSTKDGNVMLADSTVSSLNVAVSVGLVSNSMFASSPPAGDAESVVNDSRDDLESKSIEIGEPAVSGCCCVLM